MTAQLQEQRTGLENLQNQQAEDSRGISKQQKSTERYMAKKQMLINRKDECNRNIRDLGVLPEEAFEKYTNEKLDRVSIKNICLLRSNLMTSFITASEKVAYCQRRPQKVRSCQ